MADLTAAQAQSPLHERELVEIKQHLWAALGLAVIALAFFLSIDYGNQYGNDEWPSFYTIAEGSVGFLAARPLSLSGLTVVLRLLGMHQLTPYVGFVALKIGIAFVVYLLVRHFSPGRPLFAFACASVYLTYLVQDDMMVRSTYMVTLGSILLYPVLALYLHFVYMSARRPVPLMLSLVFAALAGGAYDGVFPLLIVVPVVVFAVERDFSWARMLGLGAWLAVVALGSLRLILPLLGLSRVTYASTLIDSLAPATLALRSLRQLRSGLLDPLILNQPTVLAYRLPVAITVGVMLVVLTAMRGRLQGPSGEAETSPLRTDIYWLAAGVGVTWLGILLYLPTGYGAYVERVHTLAIVGEAITISAAIWLASHLVKHAGYRRAVRYVALAVVVAFGTAQAGRLQDQVAQLGGEWESQAYYLRSLAHIAPSVEEDTLFVYVHQSEDLEPPFYSSFGFEYAMRYLYDDEADGIWAKYDVVYFRQWQASDEGIRVESLPEIEGRLWARDALYGWDEIIVVSRDASGRAVVLDRLPPELHTEARASLYAPYARVRPAFVGQRVQRWLPPLVAR